MASPSFIFGNLLNDDFLASIGESLNVLSATSEDSSFPVDNVRDDKVATVWRTALSVNAGTITANGFSFFPVIQSIAIINHNLTTTATIHIEASNNPAFPPAETTQFTMNVGTTKVDVFAQINSGAIGKDRWRIIIDDTGNPDNNLEIGELWFSEKHVEFIQSFNFGFTRDREFLQTVNTTRSGNSTVADFGLQKSFVLDWSILTDAARDQIIKLIEDSKGAFKPFLFIPNPALPEVIEVRFESRISETLTSFGRHSIPSVRLIQEVGAVSLKD